MKIDVGQMAPDFTLPKSDGTKVTLSNFRGNKKVVVYFYPKDDTPGCTAQACSFRDNYEDFIEAGAEVIGISSDSENSHTGFADKHRLPFILLADKGGKVRKQYGAFDMFGLIPGRVTFVIDLDGKVIMKFDSQLSPKKHIDKALELLRSQASIN